MTNFFILFFVVVLAQNWYEYFKRRARALSAHLISVSFPSSRRVFVIRGISCNINASVKRVEALF